jgi:hypothetical protein
LRNPGLPDDFGAQSASNFNSLQLNSLLVSSGFGRDLFSPAVFAGEEGEMSDDFLSRERYGEAFWRKHHEAWRRSEFNQRKYCEAQGSR